MKKVKSSDVRFPKVSRRVIGASVLTGAGIMAGKKLAGLGLASPVSLTEADHYEVFDAEKKDEK